MGILKNLFGVSKEKPEYERKPEISAENPDFATRSVLADLQKQLGKEPRDCNSEDFAGIKEIWVAGIWEGELQRLFLEELKLFPNLEKIRFTDVSFHPRDMYHLRQNKNKKVHTLIFERCYFEDALRLNDIYERFEVVDCKYKKDGQFWGNYPNLRELAFRGTTGENLDGRFLAKLVNLTYLEISGIGMKDCGCLEQLKSLERLKVYDSNVTCEEILNCEALKQVAVWEPLYRELVCEKERGTTKLELSLAESPFEI